jgi:adenosylhomocysteine nucleosidase
MLGIVTGLAAEARLAARLGHALAGGGFPDGAAHAAARLADDGARALLSFGLAGGLSPALLPGMVMIPALVMTSQTVFTPDAALLAWLGGGSGTLLAVDHVVSSHAAKLALRQATDADAVDMESGAVAAVARARGLPFAVLRAICDPAGADLPPAALVTLDARGAIGAARLMGSLLRHPGQLPLLLRLAGDAAAARAALRRHAAALPAFAAAP